MKRLFLLTLLVLLLAGCGYHSVGQGRFPDGVRAIQVSLFENRTYEPLLEDIITNQVIEEFSRRRPLSVVSREGEADARLEGAVTRFQVSAISYDQNDRIGQFRATVSIEATLRSFDDGSVLWKGGLSWSQHYPINADKSMQEENEAAAIRLIAERLAQNLYYRMQQNF
jgi:outer membrane lipopolysaccharide assembly protein LptE/RlpB